MGQRADTIVAAAITASTVLQYVFAGITAVGYFLSPAWMWRGIYGVTASVVVHLIFRAWHNRNLPPSRR